MSKENKNDLLNILRIQEIELQEQDKQLTKLGKTLINAVNLDIERKNRIAELESEKQKAVKEFADELKWKLDFIPFIKGRDKEIEFDDVYNLINKLLKEKGIE